MYVLRNTWYLITNNVGTKLKLTSAERKCEFNGKIKVSVLFYFFMASQILLLLIISKFATIKKVLNENYVKNIWGVFMEH